ncbi:MAG: UDP-3-O-acyl-N-acetylglucosamine deacetylase [Gammaproteobacteria bacterium]|jgi:UDP-3-O-acyl-N-acetylglucosamine deacetylase
MFNLGLGHLRERHTIRSPVAFIGIGLHSGRRVTLRILPTEAGHGKRR